LLLLLHKIFSAYYFITFSFHHITQHTIIKIFSICSFFINFFLSTSDEVIDVASLILLAMADEELLCAIKSLGGFSLGCFAN
jgi:hypothetical protein